MTILHELKFVLQSGFVIVLGTLYFCSLWLSLVIRIVALVACTKSFDLNFRMLINANVSWHSNHCTNLKGHCTSELLGVMSQMVYLCIDIFEWGVEPYGCLVFISYQYQKKVCASVTAISTQLLSSWMNVMSLPGLLHAFWRQMWLLGCLPLTSGAMASCLHSAQSRCSMLCWAWVSVVVEGARSE